MHEDHKIVLESKAEFYDKRSRRSYDNRDSEMGRYFQGMAKGIREAIKTMESLQEMDLKEGKH